LMNDPLAQNCQVFRPVVRCAGGLSVYDL